MEDAGKENWVDSMGLVIIMESSWCGNKYHVVKVALHAQHFLWARHPLRTYSAASETKHPFRLCSAVVFAPVCLFVESWICALFPFATVMRLSLELLAIVWRVSLCLTHWVLPQGAVWKDLVIRAMPYFSHP